MGHESFPCWYDRSPIDKTRIITAQDTIRAVGSMFYNEPHRATRNYKKLEEKVLKEYFVAGNKWEMAYVAAYAFYRIEMLFRTGALDPKLKPARFHMVMAIKPLAIADETPQWSNSKDMEKYCDKLRLALWADGDNGIIAKAVSLVAACAAGDYGRDNIRKEEFTQKVAQSIRADQNGGQA